MDTALAQFEREGLGAPLSKACSFSKPSPCCRVRALSPPHATVLCRADFGALAGANGADGSSQVLAAADDALGQLVLQDASTTSQRESRFQVKLASCLCACLCFAAAATTAAFAFAFAAAATAAAATTAATTTAAAATTAAATARPMLAGKAARSGRALLANPSDDGAVRRAVAAELLLVVLAALLAGALPRRCPRPGGWRLTSPPAPQPHGTPPPTQTYRSVSPSVGNVDDPDLTAALPAEIPAALAVLRVLRSVGRRGR